MRCLMPATGVVVARVPRLQDPRVVSRVAGAEAGHVPRLPGPQHALPARQDNPPPPPGPALRALMPHHVGPTVQLQGDVHSQLLNTQNSE